MAPLVGSSSEFAPLDQPEGADSLMQVYDTDDMKLDETYKRTTCEYKNTSEKFFMKENNFKKQFSKIYYSRLQALRLEVMKTAAKKWADYPEKPIPANNWMDVQKGKLCYIVGTVYKDMQLKPNILSELAQGRLIEPPPPRDKYVHEEDELVLEDGDTRVKLIGNIPLNNIVTGVVLGVLGKEVTGGDFKVIDYCYADLAPQTPLPSPVNDCNRYVALVSGLKIGKKDPNQMANQLMIDYIMGLLGASGEHALQSEIVRVVVAGNSLDHLPEQDDTFTNFKSRNVSANTNDAASSVLKELDGLLYELATGVPVDVMAGLSDPTNFSLPQQPLHSCLFPRSHTFSTFNTVTNPYSAEINGVQFLGTSGQPIDDMYRYTSINDRSVLMENSMRWRHLAPTCPDTLACYPYAAEDPFVIESSPHVYFVGNQPQYVTKTIEGSDGQCIRIIGLPSFADTQTIVLVNLKSLDCHPITFSISTPDQ